MVYDPEDHVPEYAETIKRLQAAARQEVLPMPGVVGVEDLENPQNLLDEAIIDRTEAIEVAKRKEKACFILMYHLCFCFTSFHIAYINSEFFRLQNVILHLLACMKCGSRMPLVSRSFSPVF